MPGPSAGLWTVIDVASAGLHSDPIRLLYGGAFDAAIEDGTPCPVCMRTDFASFADVDPRYAAWVFGGAPPSEGPFRLARCQGCGDLAIRPSPSAGYLEEFYRCYMARARNGFYCDDFEGTGTAGCDARAERRVAALRTLCGGRLLDVGCGPGTFLRAASAGGFVPFGVEPNAEAAVVARTRTGASVAVATIENAPWPDGSFDAVTMWDVIEHLRDPAGALERVHALLRPGGWLALETPDARSLLHRTARFLHRASAGRWRKPMSIYNVHHLHYFSEGGLRRMLARLGFFPSEGWRESTPLEGYAGTHGRLLHGALRLLFALTEVLGCQNKLILFARRV